MTVTDLTPLASPVPDTRLDGCAAAERDLVAAERTAGDAPTAFGVATIRLRASHARPHSAGSGGMMTATEFTAISPRYRG